MLPTLQGHAHCTVVDHGQADDLVAMAQQILGAAPSVFHLAGHSMGGRVALEVMRLAPERVQALALLGTGYRSKETGATGEKEVQTRQALLDLAQRDGVRAMAQAWVQNMVAPARLSDAALLKAVIHMFERQSADIFKRQIQALLARPDASAVLQQVRVPTLLMAGEWDSWASPQQHQAMAELIPARPVVQVVAGSGHMMMMEKPDTVVSHFLRWLQD